MSKSKKERINHARKKAKVKENQKKILNSLVSNSFTLADLKTRLEIIDSKLSRLITVPTKEVVPVPSSIKTEPAQLSVLITSTSTDKFDSPRIGKLELD